MKRMLVMVVVLVLAACSDDDAGSEEGGGSSEEAGFLAQFDGEITDYEGHDVIIDETERMVYVEDCAVAREMTAVDGPYGPANGENGYAFICAD